VKLSGYPLARLEVKGNPLVPLSLEFDAAVLKARGVKQVLRYSATTPRVWLLVFELEDSARAEALARHLDELLPGDAAPFYRKTTVTGGWLLVSGFPSEKPVSPEMESARTAFTSGWAGRE
jgi:hypothetical protein